MSFLKKLFGTSTDSKTPSADFALYTNTEWNFSLSHSKDWQVNIENDTDMQRLPFVTPVQLMGPKRLREHPYFTVLATVATDSGEGLAAYMLKAESDLRKVFSDFSILTKREDTLLGWPSAWMTYTYRGSSGMRQELNITTFFGRGRMIWFQFICETDKESASRDFPILERIARSLQIGPAGLRHPQVTLVGVTTCGLCGRSFGASEKPNAMVNLKAGQLLAVCNDCRNAA